MVQAFIDNLLPKPPEINNKATRNGQKHESDAIKEYEASMKPRHLNLGQEMWVTHQQREFISS